MKENRKTLDACLLEPKISLTKRSLRFYLRPSMTVVHPSPVEFLPKGFLPPMRSYAQNYEDVMLRRAFPDLKEGFYIDVGANDPQHDSATRYFYELGWRGINIEPAAQYLKLLEAARPEDVNLGVACGARIGVGTLHVIPDTGLSTIVAEYADLAKAAGHAISETVEVRVVRLDSIIQQHARGRDVDFLKINVQGSEPEVLRGINLKRYRPKVIIVEQSKGPEYHSDLLDAGYFYIWFDGLNRVYVKWEDFFRAELIARPVSIWDNATRHA
jgi:FkbM family methyltransferase